jgi:hypothetical protein
MLNYGRAIRPYNIPVESLPNGERHTQKRESDFVEFLSYQERPNGDLVAVLFNKWKNQKYFATKTAIERRMQTLKTEGELPDVSTQVLSNWPAEPS